MTRFLIELEARPADPRRPAEGDAAQRLQHLLKIAKRGLGFRCVEVRQVEAHEPQTEAAGGER